MEKLRSVAPITGPNADKITEKEKSWLDKLRGIEAIKGAEAAKSEVDKFIEKLKNVKSVNESVEDIDFASLLDIDEL